MSGNMEKLIQLLMTDEVLQQKVKAAAESYTGEQTPEAVFEAVIAPLAEEQGLPVTFEEYRALTEKVRTGEASEDELLQAAGGADYSRINGGGVGMSSCTGMGFGIGLTAGAKGGALCIVLGGGFGDSFCLAAGMTEN